MPAYLDKSGRRRQDFAEIAAIDWHLNDPETTPSIHVAAALSADRRLFRVERKLDRIVELLLSLGSDGLHEVIQYHRKTIRAKERAAREKRRKAKAEAER